MKIGNIMRLLIMTLTLLGFTGCGTTPYNERTDECAEDDKECWKKLNQRRMWDEMRSTRAWER